MVLVPDFTNVSFAEDAPPNKLLIINLLFLFVQLGHGDYSSTSTRVLRMVNTLTVDNEAKQTIEALQTELQKTKEKLQAVAELKSQSGISEVKLAFWGIDGYGN